MIYSLLLVSAGLISQASAACDRAKLLEATNTYLKAQAAGKPEDLPLAEGATYMENDATIDIKKGVLAQPITIDFNRSIHDSTECLTFTEISAATQKNPAVIGTRMIFADDKVKAVEVVVSDTGDWAFNAAGQLKWTKQEKWDAIPEDKRDKRDVIRAAGDAYLDSWGDGTVKVPYGTPCARLEGGMYTGERSATTNTCKMPEFPKPFSIKKRSYVIDEETGAVSIFNEFPFIDKAKPDGTASYNFIRVEGGMIRYIHENTVCTEKNCGR